MKDFDTLVRLLTARHSCRAFRPDPVPRETIEKIVTAAQRVPSWCNAQPWQLAITHAEETERLRQALFIEAQTGTHEPDIPFPERYSGVYQERRRTCGWQLYEKVGVARGDRQASRKQMLENFRFFGAPHIALVTSERDLGTYGVLDCGGFITAFTLAAQALGVATIPQAAVASFSPFLREWFDLPESRLVVCAISFGYEDESHPANQFRTERAPLEEVIDWKA